ncbi:porin [Pseudoalteromonas sp. NZS127_1]|uniref:porin n=1 Tax=unclassified Pseudoalteromonas TaxID=194690 RepID=UPI0013FDBAAB|nr:MULTISPECIES: porin [unclassified Pseudoalteromonas]MBG9994082.1 porin [Pseudoalteromonas sp. NZS127_1]MBH0049946.1 porin [Pseudoalteromonas sp. SWYJZ19]MBH0074459.1 porin [Pseudoalteromonas sp. SWYJ118]
MKKLSVAVAVCAVLASSYASAEVRINGFASIVGGKSLDSDSTLYGYDDDISFKNESKFALQLSADLHEKLTATAQIIARGEDDFDATFEWAYITYEYSDELQFSAGKMRVPFYKYSDFLDVGYAYRWVRPPKSVYGIPFSTYEGVSVVYSSQLGDWDSTLQGFYGAFDGDIDVFGTELPAELNNLAGINWSLSYDWFSARAAYIVADTSISSEDSGLIGLVSVLSDSGLTNTANDLITEEDKTSFVGVGFSVDYENFLFDAEYTQFEVEDSILPEQSQYYASVGYRIDSVIVHFTYEDNDDKHDSSRFNTIESIPTLNSAVNGALEGLRAQSNVYTIGARYDFHPSAAFKIDFSRFEDDITDTETDVVAVGVDLVF